MTPQNTRLFQIYETDLTALEELLPAILWANPLACNDTATRMKFRRVKEIISNVRWNYGPPTEVEEIAADDSDQNS